MKRQAFYDVKCINLKAVLDRYKADRVRLEVEKKSYAERGSDMYNFSPIVSTITY